MLAASLALSILLSTASGCIPTKPPTNNCCSALSLSTKPRVKPLGGYAGLDQCAILTYHNNEPCPSSGNIVCQIAPLSDGTTAYLQLIRGSTVVYAGRDSQVTDVFVTCSNRNWVYNGQLFDSVSCSQS